MTTLDLNETRRILSDDDLRWVRALPGVTSVCMGLRMTGGELTDEPAVVVSVREKRPWKELAKSARIPRRVAGWPTDVQEELEAAHLKPSQTTTLDLTHVRPLRSGIAVGVTSNHAGTLGFFATHTASRKAVLVSNYHVLYRDRDFLLPSDPHPVFQPIEGQDNKVADMNGALGGGQVGGELDCAFATLVIETCCCCTHSTIAHENKVVTTALTGVNHAAVGQVVTKTGIATGPTTGKIVSVDKDITSTVDYSEYNLPAGSSFAFHDLIMVVTWDPVTATFRPEVPFAAGGDSGSVLVNGAHEIVGLHFLSYHNPDNGRRYSFACHIQKVETALGVQVGGRRYATAAAPAPSPALAALDDPIDASTGEFAIAGTPDDLLAVWDRLRETLAESPAGREWLDFLHRHHYEIVHLVNHCRPVTVRWHRVEGPAYMAAVMRSARVPAYRIPDEIRGVAPRDLVAGMAEILRAHGSPALQADVESVRPAIEAALRSNDTAPALAERLAHLIPEEA